jgi:hypothetical protein
VRGSRAGPAGCRAALEEFGEANALVGGLSAPKQPGRRFLVVKGGVAASGRPAAGPEPMGSGSTTASRPSRRRTSFVAGLDVVEGESSDRGCRLGVEEDEQAGNADFRV